jgi:hypothetical protein
MNEATNLTTAWTTAQSRLPDGWRLEALRCASTGLRPEDRSDVWIAIAVGPGGEEQVARGDDPVEALFALVGVLAGV